MNKILFGGAFNPIHLGHLHMAELASKQLNAQVIFIPSKLSIWKNESIDISHRVEMVELSIKDNPSFSIDLYEVNNDKEQTYSIETVRYFVNKYPNDKFYFLIGTDQVNKFHMWREAEEISKLVQLIYYSRPNLPLEEENIQKYHMLKISGEMMDLSSTDIRTLKSLQLANGVFDYILTNNLYFVPVIRSYIGEKRYNHSVQVAKLAYEIAKSNNLPRPDRALIAGLLHDIGKEIDQKAIMEECYKDYLDLPRFAFHQFAGEYIAKKEFEVVDEEILEAIKFHATGNEKMSLLARIIYAADKIEPTRGFDSKDLIAEMMENAEKGFVTVLKANKEFLQENRGDINNRLTSKCFDYYL